MSRTGNQFRIGRAGDQDAHSHDEVVARQFQKNRRGSGRPQALLRRRPVRLALQGMLPGAAPIWLLMWEVDDQDPGLRPDLT